MSSVHPKPTKAELDTYAHVLAEKLVEHETPETLQPITTYGLVLKSGAASHQTYVDFLRAYRGLTKPGYDAVTLRFNGDPDLFEYLEDQVALHVYALLKFQVVE